MVMIISWPRQRRPLIGYRSHCMLFLGGVAWHRMPFLSHLWPCSRYEIQHFTSAILSRSSPAPRTSRQSSCHFRWCTSNQRRHLPHLKFGQPDLFFILWHQPQFSGSYQSSNPPSVVPGSPSGARRYQFQCQSASIT